MQTFYFFASLYYTCFHMFSQFSSVTKLCLTLGNPMDCSTPGVPVHHQLLESTQTHVHQVGDAIPHLILCHPLLLPPSIFPKYYNIFKSSLNIWKFPAHVLLKPGLENFEHYFASVWDECNCAVVWKFFSIAFLWDWNENWPFPVLWPLLSFPNLLAYWVQYFHSIIF